MKTNFLKYSLLAFFSMTLFVSCVGEDDFELPKYKNTIFSEGFEKYPYGNEVAVDIEGWVNVNLTGSRVWAVKQYNNNKFAEFTSFYSSATETDEVWLITPEIELATAANTFNFVTQARYHNHDNLSVWVSQNYDGTVEGISTATWQPISAYIAQSGDSNNNKFMSSGFIDFSEFNESTIRIAFKYVGSKQANKSTTYQLDNITLFEK
jgi:hypothetical protein